MNTKNNIRHRESVKKIESVFLELLQNNELSRISVSELCLKADINRSTFYSKYIDIYDLADKVVDKIKREVHEIYFNDNKSNIPDFLPLFEHIYENQLYYKSLFKLGGDKLYQLNYYNVVLAKMHFDNRFVEYHIEFFRAGLNSIIQKWLENDCRESPKDMIDILNSEYMGRINFNSD